MNCHAIAISGGRRKGRQKKRWEDNIPKSTGLKLGEALIKAEIREEWRKVVARSSLMPQRSFRLRDKWSEVKWCLSFYYIYYCKDKERPREIEFEVKEKVIIELGLRNCEALLVFAVTRVSSDRNPSIFRSAYLWR